MLQNIDIVESVFQKQHIKCTNCCYLKYVMFSHSRIETVMVCNFFRRKNCDAVTVYCAWCYHCFKSVLSLLSCVCIISRAELEEPMTTKALAVRLLSLF